MDHVLDRPLAGVASTACVLCISVAILIFYRVYVVRPRRLAFGIPAPAPIADRDLQLFTIAVGTAFAALAGMFALFVFRREEMIPWSTFPTDLAFLLVFLLVVSSCLLAIWSATRHVFGRKFVGWVGGIAIAFGAFVWSLSIPINIAC